MAVLRRGALTTVLALVTVLGGAAPAHGRTASTAVINGTAAAPGEYPYVGFLRSRDLRIPDIFDFHCGVVLVRPDVALTAAHCLIKAGHRRFGLIGPEQLQVGFGKLQLQTRAPAERIDVAQTSVPINFLPTLRGDVAVLRLATPATVPPAALAEPADTVGAPGSPVTIVGYGDTNPRNPFASFFNRSLRVARTLVQDPCRLTRRHRRISGPGVLCVGGTGQIPCFGDSGSPGLAPSSDPARPFAIGVVSSGGPRCTPKGSDVLTGLLPQSPYYDFVRQHVASPDYTAPVVQAQLPASPIRRNSEFLLRLSASEPVRATCSFGGRRGRFPCMRGTEAQIKLEAGDRESGTFRLRAFDQSRNPAFVAIPYRVK